MRLIANLKEIQSILFFCGVWPHNVGYSLFVYYNFNFVVKRQNQMH